jgi:hypothetical protein
MIFYFPHDDVISIYIQDIVPFTEWYSFRLSKSTFGVNQTEFYREKANVYETISISRYDMKYMFILYFIEIM